MTTTSHAQPAISKMQQAFETELEKLGKTRKGGGRGPSKSTSTSTSSSSMAWSKRRAARRAREEQLASDRRGSLEDQEQDNISSTDDEEAEVLSRARKRIGKQFKVVSTKRRLQKRLGKGRRESSYTQQKVIGSVSL